MDGWCQFSQDNNQPGNCGAKGAVLWVPGEDGHSVLHRSAICRAEEIFFTVWGVSHEKNKGIVPGLIPYSFDGVEKKIN